MTVEESKGGVLAVYPVVDATSVTFQRLAPDTTGSIDRHPLPAAGSHRPRWSRLP